MKQYLLQTLIILSMIYLSGCNSSKSLSSGNNNSIEDLYGYLWNLTELNGTTVNTGKAALNFRANNSQKFTGNAGCNIINGNYETKENGYIKFSPLATTRMACDPQIREQEFIETLGKVDNWSINNNQLLLKNGKTIIAKLQGRVKEIVLLDGEWELNYISGPKITFEGLYPDKKPLLVFNKNNEDEVGGNTSCNGFSGKFSINGNKISFAEPFAKTMIYCQGGGEETFLKMLSKVNHYSQSGNTLTLLFDDVAVMRFTKK